MKRKPRIVITIVTQKSTWEFSTVKGRLIGGGYPSPGPTKKQYEIATKAIADLVKA